ncbi:hypothetical protein E1B28_005186 [Marasmius oreades]|uniref:CxC1-like cysteine cluster associated with KDZ transposases domain-containing protein n=1 Tax=Marasmius oreades TaxID=181124 RepID=A0A9P8ADR2_9AGAR|nr:uncharacterized protein E1B28_005186 [Marasmius oreades]KAG7097874.1 hypothetical protein E1B28_005186 [Marasmius oreades]
MPFGTVVRSPGKKRMKARADHYVSVPGNARKRAAIQSRLASLIATARAASSPLVNDGGQTQEEMVDIAEGEPGRDVGGVDQDGIAGRNGMDIDILEPADPDSFISYITGISTPSLNLPSSDNVSTTRLSDASSLNIRWKDLLPTLMDSFLVYRNKSVRRLDPLPLQFTRHCSTGTCKPRQSKVRCYTLCSYCDIVVPHCECLTLPQVLVQHGMFPASPSRLRTAFSIELLDLYHRLWQRSSDAITSFSSALIATYKYRGFSLYGEKGGEQHDPIRRPLSQAIQWYDCLAVMVERQVNNIIDTCISEGSAPSPTAHASGSSNLRAAVDTAPTPAALEPFGSGAPGPFEELSKDECAARLQRLCPCCFGGNKYGLSFDDGGDIHVALDGNLHHRQLASAGEGVPFYDSTRFLSKAFVDSVGERMAAARKKPPKPRNPKVPDEAIDQCRESYHAAKGDSKNAASDVFRERGLMGLVCRHDIPVLIASIDTPGEQQKYAIALFEALHLQLVNTDLVLHLRMVFPNTGTEKAPPISMQDFIGGARVPKRSSSSPPPVEDRGQDPRAQKKPRQGSYSLPEFPAFSAGTVASSTATAPVKHATPAVQQAAPMLHAPAANAAVQPAAPLQATPTTAAPPGPYWQTPPHAPLQWPSGTVPGHPGYPSNVAPFAAPTPTSQQPGYPSFAPPMPTAQRPAMSQEQFQQFLALAASLYQPQPGNIPGASGYSMRGQDAAPK